MELLTGETALWEAAQRGDVLACHRALEGGCEVNAACSDVDAVVYTGNVFELLFVCHSEKDFGKQTFIVF